MDHVFDDLIGRQRARPRSSWRATDAGWALRFGWQSFDGLVIRLDIAVGRVLAG